MMNDAWQPRRKGHSSNKATGQFLNFVPMHVRILHDALWWILRRHNDIWFMTARDNCQCPSPSHTRKITTHTFSIRDAKKHQNNKQQQKQKHTQRSPTTTLIIITFVRPTKCEILIPTPSPSPPTINNNFNLKGKNRKNNRRSIRKQQKQKQQQPINVSSW